MELEARNMKIRGCGTLSAFLSGKIVIILKHVLYVTHQVAV
jgi:hypothetical protein